MNTPNTNVQEQADILRNEACTRLKAALTSVWMCPSHLTHSASSAVNNKAIQDHIDADITRIVECIVSAAILESTHCLMEALNSPGRGLHIDHSLSQKSGEDNEHF